MYEFYMGFSQLLAKTRLKDVMNQSFYNHRNALARRFLKNCFYEYRFISIQTCIRQYFQNLRIQISQAPQGWKCDFE